MDGGQARRSGDRECRDNHSIAFLGTGAGAPARRILDHNHSETRGGSFGKYSDDGTSIARAPVE